MDDGSESATNYTEFEHGHYQEAIDWFKAQGFNVNSSRYVSILRQVGDFGEGDYSADLIWGKSEVNVLYLVYRDILRYIDLGRKNVRKLLNGAIYIKDENINASENSRNYLFELSLAGIFYKAGMDVSFETDADFMFPVRPGVVGFVECKRARSLSNLQNNVDEACEQIKTRCGEYDVGVAAIDVTRLMWEHLNEQLVCATSDQIGPHLRDVFFKIVSDVKFNFSSSSCLALLGYWHIPFIRADDNSLQYYRGMEVNIKYHQEYLSAQCSDKSIYRHRAEIALQIAKQLKKSFQG